MSKKQWFVVSAVFVSAVAFIFMQFLSFHESVVEQRGIMFNDPVFRWFPKMDCSIPIFTITYGSIILYAILDRNTQYFLAKLMTGYGILMLFRILTLSIFPLKEPAELIYLQDPFLNDLIYPGRMTVDLFFSGHMGLLLLLYFFSKRMIFIVLAVILGCLLLVQRIHYSIDVLAAIPFAYISFIVTIQLIKRLSKE